MDGKRVVRVLWYACLLGLSVMVLDKLFGGITGGLKSGLSKSVGL